MKCQDCGAEGAFEVIDPYAYELYGEENWVCLCDACLKEHLAGI
jgi:hypothetical protein